MVNVRVKFFSYEWDNYQGASGKVIEIERTISINDNVTVADVNSVVVQIISQMQFKDSWCEEEFTGRGLINVSFV